MPKYKNIDRLIRRPELLLLVGYSYASIHRKMAAGEFPRPVKLSISGNAVGWRMSEVQEWLESRIPV